MSRPRRSRYVLSAISAFGGAFLVTVPGSGATVKLSEHSAQPAYSAGLGFRVSSRVAQPVTSSNVRCAGRVRALGSAKVAYAALIRNEADFHAEPQSRSPVVARSGRININGFRAVVAVIGVHLGARCSPDWYRAQLPVVPNGKTGWVRAWAVQTYRVHSRIEVDITQRRLRLFRWGRLALQARVAVGAAATPTPVGRYFVNERYVLPDVRGPFGPNALGISAHSTVLQHVWVEDGPIGIHGTNEPSSIGYASSHGCIRVDNAVMRRLFPLAPAGTPVIIKS